MNTHGEHATKQLAMLALAAMALCPTAGVAAERWAVPASGEPFLAQLEEIDAQWRVTLHTDTGSRSLPAADLVRWGGRVDIQDGAVVAWADGGVLVADALRIDQQGVHATCELWGRVSFPVEQARGILLHVPTSPSERDRLLRQIMSATIQTDLLLLDNGDSVSGNVITLDQRRTRVHSDSTVDLVIDTERISAILLRRSPAQIPAAPLYGRFGFADGTSLSAARAVLADGRLSITTVGGLPLSTDPSVDARREIVSLQPIGGAVTYVSDQEPASYAHRPYLALSWPLGIDRQADGGQLRAGGLIYDKGLGMHSSSRVVYRLARSYDRFAAELAIDDRAGRGGSVLFRILIETGQGTWDEVFASPILRGGQAPVPISVNVRQAQHIALAVDCADRADQLDRADWLDARLVKQGE